MTPENRQLFFDHAVKETPREACAVLVIFKGREILHICKNKSIFNDQFSIDPKDYTEAALKGEVVGIIHSHVNISATPSEADRVSCEASGVEWHICSVPTAKWFSFTPSGFKAPLIGRTWAHGVLDCYSYVQDYYREKLGITLMDFDREFEWWDKGGELYCDANWTMAGFKKVMPEELRVHDALIFQIRAKVPNHAGIYEGNDIFSHHLTRRLSSRDVYAGYYRKHTVKVLRYVGI